MAGGDDEKIAPIAAERARHLILANLFHGLADGLRIAPPTAARCRFREDHLMIDLRQ